MPTYSYACAECDTRFDVRQAFTDDALTECPTCGGRVRKLFGSVGVVFKGSGFYRTDSRTSSSGTSSDGSGESSKKTGESTSSDGSKESSTSTSGKESASTSSSSSTSTAKNGSSTGSSSTSKAAASSS